MRAAAVMTRPLITTDPAVNHGQPMVGPAPVDAVCARIWAGEPLADVAADYGISREQVLVACWWQARYGTPTWRRRLAVWFDIRVVIGLIEGEYDAIPDPPTKELSTR
jgi:uncharacterized protein (DUF433 family)